MKGKVGLIVGLAAGYVLGARAGRERYEQIKEQADKVWHSAPVQEKVDLAKDFATSSVMALPNAVWKGAVKVTKAATSSKGSVGDKIDSTVAAGRRAGQDVQKAAKTSADATKRAADDAKAKAEKTAADVKAKAEKTADDVADAVEKTADDAARDGS